MPNKKTLFPASGGNKKLCGIVTPFVRKEKREFSQSCKYLKGGLNAETNNEIKKKRIDNDEKQIIPGSIQNEMSKQIRNAGKAKSELRIKTDFQQSSVDALDVADESMKYISIDVRC